MLVTRFLQQEGIIEVIDYMPVGLKQGDRGFRHLVRRVEAVRQVAQEGREGLHVFNSLLRSRRIDLLEG